MSHLPNDKKAQEKIANAIEEIVNTKVQIEDKQSFIKDVKSRIEEETGLKGKDLMAYADKRYKQIYKTDKYEEEREFNENCYSEIDILFGDK